MQKKYPLLARNTQFLRKSVRFCILMACLIMSFQNQLNAQTCARRIVWQDEFNVGSNLNNRWNFFEGPNGANREAAYFQRNNSTIVTETPTSTNGVLRIEARPETVPGTNDPSIGAPYRFTSSRLSSKSTVDISRIRQGRIEARIRTMRDGDRTWPAFWLLHTRNEWPRRGELDIMEQRVRINTATGRGRNMKKNGAVTFFQNPGIPCPANVNGSNFTCFDNVITDGRDHELPASVSDDDNTSASYWGGYHIYALEWTPTQLQYYYDNTLVHTVNKSTIDGIGAYWPYNENDYYIILNVAVGNSDTGYFANLDGNTPGNAESTRATNPAYFTGRDVSMYVDYVRVYQTDAQNFITGNDTPYNSEVKQYQLNKQITSPVTWSVTPASAATISGSNGNNTVEFAWASTIPSNATVNATYTQGGCTANITLPIKPQGNRPAGSTVKNIENFTTNPVIPRTTGTNTFSAGGAPTVLGVAGGNALIHVSGGGRFDFVSIATSQIKDAGLYAMGFKKMLVDIYTDAPVGTKMAIQLENGSVATATNYPSGRHSGYGAYTTVRNRWHTLEFVFESRPDGATNNFNVNNLVILCDADANIPTAYTYRIDNIREISNSNIPVLSLNTPLLEDYDPLRGRITANSISSPGYSVVTGGGVTGNGARFVRPAGGAGQYSSIGFITTGVRVDGSDFRTQRYQFRMRVRTNQLNKRIQLNLENTYLKQNNEFGGTNGVYFATTSSTLNTGWQTLTFVKDQSWFNRSTKATRITQDDEINRISIYPNIGFSEPAATTYDFDNIEIVAGTLVPDEGVNIALRKPTTATSFRIQEPTQIGTAATDGDAGSNWKSAFEPRPASDRQDLTVNLNGQFNVDSIRVNWPESGARALTYRVEYTNDAAGSTGWTTLVSNNAGVVGLYTARFPARPTARWIRLVCLTPNTGAFYGYVVSEFEAYGTPILPDIALNKIATASSSRTATTYRPSEAVDGNSATAWGSDFTTAPNNLTTTAQTLTVNLNGFFNIASLRINWADLGAFARDFRIETTDDAAGATGWVVVDSRTAGTAGFDNKSFGVFTPRARWIRIVCTSPNTGSFFGYVINDFNVYGSPIASGARQSAESQIFEREVTQEEAEQNKVYPNPSNDFITVVIPGKAENKGIVMSDMTGRTVMQHDLAGSQEEHTIDIRALNEGMYLLLIKNDEKIDVKKVMKLPK